LLALRPVVPQIAALQETAHVVPVGTEMRECAPAVGVALYGQGLPIGRLVELGHIGAVDEGRRAGTLARQEPVRPP